MEDTIFQLFKILILLNNFLVEAWDESLSGIL